MVLHHLVVWRESFLSRLRCSRSSSPNSSSLSLSLCFLLFFSGGLLRFHGLPLHLRLCSSTRQPFSLPYPRRRSSSFSRSGSASSTVPVASPRRLRPSLSFVLLLPLPHSTLCYTLSLLTNASPSFPPLSPPPLSRTSP